MSYDEHKDLTECIAAWQETGGSEMGRDSKLPKLQLLGSSESCSTSPVMKVGRFQTLDALLGTDSSCTTLVPFRCSAAQRSREVPEAHSACRRMRCIPLQVFQMELAGHVTCRTLQAGRSELFGPALVLNAKS